MIATEIFRGHSPSNNNNNSMAPPPTGLGRAFSPTEALVSEELAMRTLFAKSYAAKSVSPSMSPRLHGSSSSAVGSLPLLARAATGSQGVVGSSAAFLDHYACVVRSRAFAQSVLEYNAAAAYGRRVIPARKMAMNTKFSLLARPPPSAFSRAMMMKKLYRNRHPRGGLKPLRAPPALPKVVPGQGLVGMKPPVANPVSAKKE